MLTYQNYFLLNSIQFYHTKKYKNNDNGFSSINMNIEKNNIYKIQRIRWFIENKNLQNKCFFRFPKGLLILNYDWKNNLRRYVDCSIFLKIRSNVQKSRKEQKCWQKIYFWSNLKKWQYFVASIDDINVLYNILLYIIITKNLIKPVWFDWYIYQAIYFYMLGHT